MDGREREQWLAERRTGIGGTDAAAILGLSPFATPYDVWLTKVTDEIIEQPESERMWWGANIEHLIAQRYELVTHRRVMASTLLRHPVHDMLIASPDRLVIGERRGLEIKNVDARNADEWGKPGTDDVPLHYLAQVRHYMLVTGFPVWDVAALIGGNDLRIYTVHDDPDYNARACGALVEWWGRYVVTGERPVVTGAESTKRLLAARFPVERAPMLEADPATEALIVELGEARKAADAAEAWKATVENRIKGLIGEAAGVKGRHGSVTWTSTRGRRSTDWEALARYLGVDLSPSTFAALVDEHTRTAAGYRRFVYRQHEEAL